MDRRGVRRQGVGTGRRSAGRAEATSRSETAVTIRRLKRLVDKKTKLPRSLVEELARTAVLGQSAWEQARRENNFAHFQPWLAKTFELKRQQAEALGYRQSPYDALLDDYEPEELTANVGRVLADLREQLVAAGRGHSPASGRRPDTSLLSRDYPIDVQESFGKEAAAAIGFDFARGRLDVTAHPFCTTLGPHDCRITTRYDEHFFNAAFFGILHEAGHGIYEQGLPPDRFGLPLGEAVSLGIHESQSRLWENLVGRSRAFWQHFYPAAQKRFPAALGSAGLDAFYFAVNDVRPSLIRVEADEATYNLHILIRFELEQALLSGDLPVADAPAAWNEKYRQYLGIAADRDADGVLQDVHWSARAGRLFPHLHPGQSLRRAVLRRRRPGIGRPARPVRAGRVPAVARLAPREDPSPRPALFGRRTRETGHRTGIVVGPAAGASAGEVRGAVRALTLNHRIIERLPHLAGDVGIGLGIADELLFLRVPLQLAAQPNRGHAQMAHAGRAVADLGRADRRLAALHALDEVAHVIVAYVDPLGAGGQFLRE